MSDDEWSDSDSEPGGDVETAVLLGVPDGALSAPGDAADAAVSRLGGSPVRPHVLCVIESSFISVSAQAFLTASPRADAAECKSCGARMPLLAQVWCPREGAAHDRALYVWGCARARCQRADGRCAPPPRRSQAWGMNEWRVV
jgi:pre-rRNA-processing protein TSR4